MIGRPSLLVLTAAATAIAGIANAVGLATPEPSRLGVAIDADVAARDKGAIRRSRALELREQALRAAETRLKADLAQRPPPADAAPIAPVEPGTAPNDPFDDLAKIYQAMKPAAAALVLEQLDLDVQMRVAQRMRERSTAMILAAMTPKAAAALTMALARRRAPQPAVGRPMVAGRPAIAGR